MSNYKVNYRAYKAGDKSVGQYCHQEVGENHASKYEVSHLLKHKQQEDSSHCEVEDMSDRSTADESEEGAWVVGDVLRERMLTKPIVILMISEGTPEDWARD